MNKIPSDLAVRIDEAILVFSLFKVLRHTAQGARNLLELSAAIDSSGKELVVSITAPHGGRRWEMLSRKLLDWDFDSGFVDVVTGRSHRKIATQFAQSLVGRHQAADGRCGSINVDGAILLSFPVVD